MIPLGRFRRFLRAVYRDNLYRLPEQRRSLPEDIRLLARNLALRPVERYRLLRQESGENPVLFIVGLPRSGTTLLHQLIADQLVVEYISNFVARYWLAPLVGLQRFRRRYPRGAEGEDSSLASDFGVATGPTEPHEFSWFWHYWMDRGDSDHLTESELDSVDFSMLRRELEALASWAGLPLVLKPLVFVDYHVERFSREIPSAKFVWIRREPLFVAQSILEARRRRYGSASVWWSIRPRDWRAWLERDPVEQIAHQMADVGRAIGEAFERLPGDRAFVCSYEELTEHPGAVLSALASFLPAGVRDAGSLAALHLEGRNCKRLPATRLQALESALSKLGAKPAESR